MEMMKAARRMTTQASLSLLLFLFVVGGAAQESVDITVPVSVTFSISNVSQSTSGSPSSTAVSFDNAILDASRALKISIKADSANFSPPSGPAISATNVSWTTSGASGGTGSSGTLSSSVYNQVFESSADPTSGGVDLHWTLAAPGSDIRSGNHNLTVRWKLESIVP